MRRKDSQIGFGKSFDSFLSIVTKNGLGMLILIAMASTFANVQSLGEAKFKRNLGTPIIKFVNVPGTTQFATFECRGGKIFPIEFEPRSYQKAKVLFNEYDSRLKLGFQTSRDHEDFLSGPMAKLAQDFNAEANANDFHTFEFVADAELTFLDEELKLFFKNLQADKKARYKDFADYKTSIFMKRPALRFHPRPEPKSEDLADALKPGSRFRTSLDKIKDKKTGIVDLRVWPDSVPFFRELREWLGKEGYQVSWRPTDKPLSWRPGGGKGDLKIPIN